MVHIKTFIISLCSISMLLCACGNNNDSGSSTSNNPPQLDAVISSTIDNVIIPTYRLLAQRYDAFYQAATVLDHKTLTQNQINDVCRLFLSARNTYEYSESFFFGADAHFDVDADINQWPLDITLCEQYLNNGHSLVDPSDWPSSIVGWHGIEYILFRDGKPRLVSNITARELQYIKTLSGQLRLRCYQLVCGWDTKANSTYKELLKANHLEYTSPLGGDYKTYMQKNFTAAQASSTILVGDHGMVGLADEISKSKLGRPYNYNNSSYIESPFSHMSLNDMLYNVASIQNLWYGQLVNDKQVTQSQSNSFDHYFFVCQPELCNKVRKAIEQTQQAIKNIPAPFVSNYASPQVKYAIEQAEALSEILGEANEYIQKYHQ